MSDSSPPAQTRSDLHTQWPSGSTWPATAAAVFAEEAQSFQFLLGNHGEESKQSWVASSWSLGNSLETLGPRATGGKSAFFLRIRGQLVVSFIWAHALCPFVAWPLAFWT